MIYTPGRKTTILSERVLKLNAGKVLDVGCSSGFLGLEIRKKNASIAVYGIDQSSKALDEAGKNSYQKTWKLNLNDENDVEKLNQLPEEFDAIVLADVLEHSLFPEKILKNLKGKLKQDGVFLITIPNIGFLPLRLKHLFGMWKYEPSGIMDDSHVKFYTLNSCRQLIENAGMKISSFECFPKKLPSWIWPSMLAITFLFEARKN